MIVQGETIAGVAATTCDAGSRPGIGRSTLREYTLMPGLIDVHTHLTMANNFDPYFELTMTPAKEAIIGVENAKATLEAGFTTVRNVGASDFTDVALRDEINAGHIPGPHMQVSGPPLGITGGHMDENLLPYQYHVMGEGVADGIAAVQHMVRQNIKYGADLIKIGATGGVLSKGDDPQASAVHAGRDAGDCGGCAPAGAEGGGACAWGAGDPVGERGGGGLDRAWELYLDDAGIAMMKKHGTYLVPTAYLIDWMQGEREAAGVLPAEDEGRERGGEGESRSGRSRRG